MSGVSDSEKVYLRPNIQVEPLIHNWYTWIHLIPPATAALNLQERYLNLLKSYVNSPFMHVAAVANPQMRGGPFVDLGGARLDEVQALIEQTTRANEEVLAFARDLHELDRMLQERARGHRMEPLYEQIPPRLRGYVELCYDLHNHPSFRLFESLLYRSPYYREEAQNIALSAVVQDRDRPFVMSTPRLPDEKTLRLQLPFRSEGLDELFKMKRQPQSPGYLRERLGVEIEREELFESFFTEVPPPPYREYEGGAIRIRYFGHACLLLETREVKILLDPVLSYTYEADVPRYTYQDLPDWIDYVLITHSHHDHILFETLLQLRHKVGQILVGHNYEGFLQDPSLYLALRQIGFDKVREIRDLEEVQIPSGSITCIPFLGEHHDLYIHSRSCFLVRVGERSVISVSDSCNIEPVLYERVHDITGDADMLFLGMECDGAPVSWIYGPLLAADMEREYDHSRRARGCNAAEGLDLAQRFNCREVYVYAMGQEPWLKHILANELAQDSNPLVQARLLVEQCRARGMVAEHLFGEKEILTDQ